MVVWKECNGKNIKTPDWRHIHKVQPSPVDFFSVFVFVLCVTRAHKKYFNYTFKVCLLAILGFCASAMKNNNEADNYMLDNYRCYVYIHTPICIGIYKVYM